MNALRAFGVIAVASVALAGCSALIGFDQPAERGAQCTDGVDNDGNGRADCEESSCADVCSAACGDGTGADGAVVDLSSGHCYLGFATARETIAANEMCMALGGYLAVPDDAEEDGLIRSVAPPSASLGLADFDYRPEYMFRQVTGDRPADYLNFSPGQPDGGGGAPLCVSYDGVASTWKDDDCTTPRPYVCEVTPAPCGDLVRQPSEGCDDGNAVAGDGCAAACVDEDECAMGTDNCHANADCLNQNWTANNPGFSCQCRGGFVGDGVSCTALPPPPTFETRGPTTLAAALTGCTTAVPRRGRKIDVDPFGALYVVVNCSGTARVTVSVDAGATWSAPQSLGTNLFDAAVVGVSPGRAVVGMAFNNGDVVVQETVDFGMTWQPIQMVQAGTDIVPGISLATDGSDVLVGLHPSSGGYRVLRSMGPGLVPFHVADTPSVAFGDVLVNPQSPSQVFAVGDTQALHVSESGDGGLTFAAEVMPSATQQLSDWAIGGGFIYAAGQQNDVARMSVSAVSTVDVAGGLVDAMGGERSIVAGPDGAAYVAYTGSSGVEVARWDTAQTVFDAPVIIEPMSDTPSIAVVGNGLIAAVYQSLGDIRFAIVIPIQPQ